MNSFTVYLDKYSKTLSLLFDFFKTLNVFWQNTIICFSKTLVLLKSQYTPRNKLNMAMLLLINASRNLKFLFFYITWAKFRVSFQSQNSHHWASRISMNFRNPKKIFHFVNINTHLSNIYLLVQKDISVIWFHFQTTFSISRK